MPSLSSIIKTISPTTYMSPSKALAHTLYNEVTSRTSFQGLPPESSHGTSHLFHIEKRGDLWHTVVVDVGKASDSPDEFKVSLHASVNKGTPMSPPLITMHGRCYSYGHFLNVCADIIIYHLEDAYQR